jgi:hypothetical protein
MNQWNQILWLDIAEFEALANRSSITVIDEIRSACRSMVESSLRPSYAAVAKRFFERIMEKQVKIGVSRTGKMNETGEEAVVLVVVTTPTIVATLAKQWGNSAVMVKPANSGYEISPVVN